MCVFMEQSIVALIQYHLFPKLPVGWWAKTQRSQMIQINYPKGLHHSAQRWSEATTLGEGLQILIRHCAFAGVGDVGGEFGEHAA